MHYFSESRYDHASEKEAVALQNYPTNSVPPWHRFRNSCPSPKPRPATKGLIFASDPARISSHDQHAAPPGTTVPVPLRPPPPARPREPRLAPPVRRVQENGHAAQAVQDGSPRLSTAPHRCRPGGRSSPTTSATWSLSISSRAPPRACGVLFGLVVLVHPRRRVLHFNVTEHPIA